MTKLTEEMIIAKTKQSNLGAIKKMNCWGSELVDVSLLRRLNNIEVLSLSVNKIASLSDFQYCRNLQELFVRKNNIRELNQVCYLQNLPKLVNLWLDENPCTECDGYRLTVIRTLPNLKKLDNVPVDPEELEEALHKGRELIHPEEEVMMSPDRESGHGRRNSRPPAATVTSQDMEHDYYETESQENSHSPDQAMSYAQSNQIHSSTPYYRAPQYEDDGGWASAAQGAQGDSSGSESSPSAPGVSGLPRARPSEDDMNTARTVPPPQLQPAHPYYHLHHIDPYQADPYQQAEQVEVPHPSQQYASERPRTADRAAPPREGHRCAARTLNHQPPYHRRPTSRNSNILSAVLCLVKELDYPSLEVVEMAIRCRMDELED
ncbi:hypothetical protein LSTR_LSTR009519 [Laodelphax striatellus]|uniref:U2A'/phosphoprotein 32 family A C-terminal domain-containing protein n=1 Tax=Laodelphax striatellus TaxID=195883 RepID=A0A482XNB2_LAOST|nr:hypothetical protein LSTR_LSTR009519 [Laodelphax striatellus]